MGVTARNGDLVKPIWGSGFFRSLHGAVILDAALMEAWGRSYSFSGSEGSIHEGILKATSVHGVLQWEARRHLPAVGYEQRSAGTKFCLVWRDQLDAWDAEMTYFGIQPSDHRGSSFNSMYTKSVEQMRGKNRVCNRMSSGSQPLPF